MELIRSEWPDVVEHLRPRSSANGECTESESSYSRRVQEILPSSPMEVIVQWFYEHWEDISRYAWLGFSRFRFVNQLWSSQAVVESGIRENPSVRIDHRHYLKGNTSTRITRIVDFFQQHGTWPVRPVFLENQTDNLVHANGHRLTCPYHLLEGHHRAALFWAFHDEGKPQPEHGVWVASIEEP